MRQKHANDATYYYSHVTKK